MMKAAHLFALVAKRPSLLVGHMVVVVRILGLHTLRLQGAVLNACLHLADVLGLIAHPLLALLGAVVKIIDVPGSANRGIARMSEAPLRELRENPAHVLARWEVLVGLVHEELVVAIVKFPGRVIEGGAIKVPILEEVTRRDATLLRAVRPRGDVAEAAADDDAAHGVGALQGDELLEAQAHYLAQWLEGVGHRAEHTTTDRLRHWLPEEWRVRTPATFAGADDLGAVATLAAEKGTQLGTVHPCLESNNSTENLHIGTGHHALHRHPHHPTLSILESAVVVRITTHDRFEVVIVACLREAR
mmetsp:Transcript_119809/g.267465  ORF Transcript_119809/g.267465 Transcript_119809/m.267465 type:complete len:302 (-) Transcript_119809:600-1505(-)